MNIGKLNHRIALCSMRDVVEAGGEMALTRHEVARLWAYIEPTSYLASFLSRSGYAIQESAMSPTHLITIRNLPNIEISSAAWVYEEKRQSAPRWYKVLGFTDMDNWVRLTTHLVERSDRAQAPVSGLAAQPSAVTL